MRISLIAVLAPWSAVLVCVTANAAPTLQQSEPISSCVALVAATVGFNGSFYARHGDFVIENSFGTADAAGQVRVSSQTRFNIASAGKMFTAVAIGRLVDRGAIRFDAPVGRYLSGLKPDFSSITVAQLLNHTSGLGDYFNPVNKAAIDAAVTATDLLPLAIASPPALQPGSRRSYSNSGFVVLGAIVEAVSQISYADFVQKEILDPLNMTATRLDASGSSDPMTRMSPEGRLQTARLSPLRQWRASPAGGMFSTPSDIAIFLTALGDEHFLTRETMRALLLSRPDPGGDTGVHGYGFNVRVGPPLRVGHGGGAPGVNAEIALYLESGWQLIALSNNDPPTASRMVAVLEKAIFSSEPVIACAAALEESAKQRK